MHASPVTLVIGHIWAVGSILEASHDRLIAGCMLAFAIVLVVLAIRRP